MPLPGLVAWWPGDGNANDMVGTNNGVLEGSVAFAAGEVGQAFSFDGTNAHVVVAASSSLHVGAGSGLTVEAWVKPEDVSIGQPLVEWNDGFFDAHFWISYPSPGMLYANLVDTSRNYHVFASAGGLLTQGSYQHVALTYDKSSGTGTFFVNGGVVTQQNLGSFTPETRHALYLGLRPSGGVVTRFAGQMDEVCVYDRALSVADVQAIFNAGSAGKCQIPLITSQPRNQVGYWGKSIAFNVHALGGPPLAYQWLKNGTPIDGATGPSIVLTNLQMTDAGSYSVVVTNAYGSIISSKAYLTMNPAGVSLALYAGVTIDGVPGLTYGIQYTTDLSNTNSWQGAANVTLSVPTMLWFDVQPATPPQRYYRVVPGPITIP